ncbi:MAG: hypothetical protein HUU50_22200 [Candidatus Brocadiae bacterium]|nr:hypothetical protein [Candidatus Brocadiia bacterium]
MIEWYSEELRITAFLCKEQNIEIRKWWTSFVKNLPIVEAILRNQNIYQLEGLYGNKKLILRATLSLDRIDWLLVNADELILDSKKNIKSIEEIPEKLSLEYEKTHFPRMPKFNEEQIALIDLIKKWTNLDTFPSCYRLALGANLFFPVKTRQEGYIILAQLLPNVKIDIENSENFLYQINRPKPSNTCRSLKINKISRWIVATHSAVAINVENNMITQNAENPIFSCSLNLDISTSQENRDEISKEYIPSIYEEMLGIAKEVALEGDK